MMKTNSPIIDLIFGVVLSFLGAFITINIKKLTTAMLASNKIFWEKLNIIQVKEANPFFTKMIVQLIGLIFIVTGVLLVYRFIHSRIL